jgi:hypothetical protein
VTETRSDLYLRFTRRGLATVLIVILVLGIGCLLSALVPDGRVSRSMQRSSWLIPIAIAIAVVALQAPLRKHHLTTDSPEAKVVMEDELRRLSMDRARKFAFGAVLIAQVPLALLFSRWPSLHALLAMAVATITLGMTVMIALFLAFDRE